MSVSSSESDPVSAIIDLLDNYSGWSLTAPLVDHQADVPQKERENRSNPSIYVWSPVEGSFEGLGAKREKTIDTDTVEASIWVLADADGSGYDDIETYFADARNFLEDYVTDNTSNTTFHKIRPVSGNDARAERVARMTDHYVMSIQIEVGGFRSSGT